MKLEKLIVEDRELQDWLRKRIQEEGALSHDFKLSRMKCCKQKMLKIEEIRHYRTLKNVVKTYKPDEIYLYCFKCGELREVKGDFYTVENEE